MCSEIVENAGEVCVEKTELPGEELDIATVQEVIQ